MCVCGGGVLVLLNDESDTICYIFRKAARNGNEKMSVHKGGGRPKDLRILAKDNCVRLSKITMATFEIHDPLH